MSTQRFDFGAVFLVFLTGAFAAPFSACSKRRFASTSEYWSLDFLPMKPPYHIPLTMREKAHLGEICALQGSIEFDIQICLTMLLGLDMKVVQRICPASLRTTSEIWIGVIRGKVKDDWIRAVAEAAFKEFDQLSSGRNDFVHAMYGFTFLQEGEPLGGIGRTATKWPKEYTHLAPAACRTSNMKITLVSDIKGVRDRASRVANLVSLVQNAVQDHANQQSGNPLPPSRRPSLKKLGVEPLPSPQTAELRSGKTLTAPPKSSRGSRRKRPLAHPQRVARVVQSASS
jgi:hypothetical protein